VLVKIIRNYVGNYRTVITLVMHLVGKVLDKNIETENALLVAVNIDKMTGIVTSYVFIAVPIVVVETFRPI